MQPRSWHVPSQGRDLQTWPNQVLGPRWPNQNASVHKRKCPRLPKCQPTPQCKWKPSLNPNPRLRDLALLLAHPGMQCFADARWPVQCGTLPYVLYPPCSHHAHHTTPHIHTGARDGGPAQPQACGGIPTGDQAQHQLRGWAQPRGWARQRSDHPTAASKRSMGGERQWVA